MTHVLNENELGGWVIERQRSDYSLGYWVAFVIEMLGQSVPTPPDITYTLRNSSSGELRTIALPGDHARSDLVEAIARVRGYADHSIG
jgi:hypothetical protein